MVDCFYTGIVMNLISPQSGDLSRKYTKARAQAVSYRGGLACSCKNSAVSMKAHVSCEQRACYLKQKSAESCV